MRHAHAANLWIELTQVDEGLEIAARDHGRGARSIRPGHGPIGMRERLEAVSGRPEVESEAEWGFRLRARIPLSEGTAS